MYDAALLILESEDNEEAKRVRQDRYRCVCICNPFCRGRSCGFVCLRILIFILLVLCLPLIIVIGIFAPPVYFAYTVAKGAEGALEDAEFVVVMTFAAILLGIVVIPFFCIFAAGYCIIYSVYFLITIMCCNKCYYTNVNI